MMTVQEYHIQSRRLVMIVNMLGLIKVINDDSKASPIIKSIPMFKSEIPRQLEPDFICGDSDDDTC